MRDRVRNPSSKTRSSQLPPEDEIARLRVENEDQGASFGPGCRLSDQAASRLALSGIHPSRVEI